MHRPCRARSASRTPKLGETATSAVGRSAGRSRSVIARRRPTRSENGPHSHPPAPTATTTTPTVRPARAGETPNSRPSSGRIAWVEYIVANIAAAPRRKPAMDGRAPAAAAGAGPPVTPAPYPRTWDRRRSSAPERASRIGPSSKRSTSSCMKPSITMRVATGSRRPRERR